MRNETLKNLLLTASLISASALLTACGDDAKDPAKPDAQKTAGEEVKDTANQDALEFDVIDAQLPPKVEKAPADAMVKAKMAYLDFEKKIIPQTTNEVTAKLANISFPKINFEQKNLVNLKKQLDLANTTLANTAKISLDDQITKLEQILADRVKLRDAYIKEVRAYYSPANYSKEADITKREEVIESLLTSFEKSQQILTERLERIQGYVSNAERMYNIQRQQLTTEAAEFKANIDKIEAAGGNQTQQNSLSWSLTRSFFSVSPTYSTTPLFLENWDKYYLSVKDKLVSCSMTKDEFVTDFLDKFKTFIAVQTRGANGTLDELSKQLSQVAYQTIYARLKRELTEFFSLDTHSWRFFFKDGFPEVAAAATAQAAGLSAGTLGDISGNLSLRQARTSATGSADLRAFNVNGAGGESIALGMPLFVQLKGDVSSSKATEAATGSVAYRLGNTVIGAIQGYANSGDGFGIEGRQFETSVVASHSFGSFFIEGQLGTVSATDVHSSNWKGLRSQVTLGLDTEFVSPFVQLTHRQLDRSGLDLNQTTGFVGLDMDVAKLKADSYSVDARLTAKVGYGEKAWSVKATDLGSTTDVSGSVEWAGSLNLNSGVKFTTNLGLDTVAGSSAAVNVSLDR